MPLFGDEVRAWARWKEGARGAAAAPRGISSWMHGMRCSLTGFPVHRQVQRSTLQSPLPAAGGASGTCARFAPRAADLLFVQREPFIW